MKYVRYFAIFISGLALFSCSKDLSPLENKDQIFVRPLTVQESAVVESSQDFSLKLFKAISALPSEAESNLFISPFSVSTALSMALNGAAGQTYSEMQTLLELSDLSEDERNSAYKTVHELLSGIDQKVLFEIANSMWYRYGFQILPDFVETNRRYFYAEVASLDFSAPSATDIINNWVNEKTHGKIDKILNEIPEDAVLYIINAIYFKAMWQYEFDKEYTQEENFYVTPQTPVKTAMMKTTADLKYYEDSTAQVVDLPYGRGHFSMTVFLPKPAVSLDEFIANMDNSRWNRYLNHLEVKNGTVGFPKLKIEYKLLMNDVLQQLGMSSAFDGGADFSRIRASGGIFISRVIHKTFLQVDEEGTEAAAATVIGFRETSIGPEPDFYMNLNRPFMFVIREKETGAILFMGKIIKPSWEE